MLRPNEPWRGTRSEPAHAILEAAPGSFLAIVDAEFVHPSLAEGIQSLVMRLPPPSGR
jgi:hypothetical protein